MISGSWPPIKCGVGDFCRRLAVEMSAQGTDVTAITDRGAHAQPDEGVAVSAEISHWGPAALPAVLHAIAAARPDVVNLHYPTVNYHRLSLVDLLPTAVRLSLRLPVVTTIHEFSTFRCLGRARVTQMARSSSGVIVPDQENYRLLQASLGANRRLTHIPLGPAIDPHLLPNFDRMAWRQAQGLDAQTLLLVYFGFISPSKGLDTLLHAFAQLPTDLNLTLCLLADREPSAPQYTNYHRQIATQVAQLEHSHPIRWTGYLPADAVSTWLAAADLAVLPFTDGASLRRTTLLACIAHGLPVLSTGEYAPIGGVDVVPVGDAAALVLAIKAFRSQPARLVQLRRQAEEAAVQISWPSIAQQTIHFLAEMTR